MAQWVLLLLEYVALEMFTLLVKKPLCHCLLVEMMLERCSVSQTSCLFLDTFLKGQRGHHPFIVFDRNIGLLQWCRKTWVGTTGTPLEQLEHPWLPLVSHDGGVIARGVSPSPWSHFLPLDDVNDTMDKCMIWPLQILLWFVSDCGKAKTFSRSSC
jgi:hypothetical protein